MKIPFTGGCVCGAIRYECSAEPIMMCQVHCRDWQQVAGYFDLELDRDIADVQHGSARSFAPHFVRSHLRDNFTIMVQQEPTPPSFAFAPELISVRFCFRIWN